MVDPVNITNFNRTDVELEEFMCFSILVAGKNALTTAKRLDVFFNKIHLKLNIQTFCPFCVLRQFSEKEIALLLQKSGIGCFNNKAKSIYQLVNAGLDLRECTVDQMEKIFGIGCKTSRFFKLHAIPNQEYAVLDIHVLRYMADNGVVVPKTTPTGNKYKELEIKFLEMAKKANQTPADFDLNIWREYSGRIAC